MVSAGVAEVATGVSVSSASALEPVADSVVEVLYSDDEALASAAALLAADSEVSADEADEALASVDSVVDATDDSAVEASASVEALEPVDEAALLEVVVVVVELEVPLPPARGTQSSVESRQCKYPNSASQRFQHRNRNLL